MLRGKWGEAGGGGGTLFLNKLKQEFCVFCIYNCLCSLVVTCRHHSVHVCSLVKSNFTSAKNIMFSNVLSLYILVSHWKLTFCVGEPKRLRIAIPFWFAPPSVCGVEIFCLVINKLGHTVYFM